MKLTYYLVAVISAVGVYAQSPDPMINTPGGVQQCLPSQLTFSGSSPPFIITAVPGGQTDATPLATIGTTSSNSITWTPQLAVGTSVTLVIRDSLGRTNPSGTFSIIQGNTDCVGQTSAAGASSAVDTTPAGSSVAVTTPLTTPVATTSVAVTSAVGGNTVTTTGKTTVSSVVGSATTATTTSGAEALKPGFVAGLLGLVGAAALL